jgi:hypothetical protein
MIQLPECRKISEPLLVLFLWLLRLEVSLCMTSTEPTGEQESERDGYRF